MNGLTNTTQKKWDGVPWPYPLKKWKNKPANPALFFANGEIKWVVSRPLTEECRASRFLKRHPAGVMSISFEVHDIQKTWDFLNARGGTPVHGIKTTETTDGGYFKHFSITTPIGDLTFRFIEKEKLFGFCARF